LQHFATFHYLGAFQIVAKASGQAAIFNAEKTRKGVIAEVLSVEKNIATI
jgi:hypothetical protein